MGSSDSNHPFNSSCWTQYSSGVNPPKERSLDARAGVSAAHTLVTTHTASNAETAAPTAILVLEDFILAKPDQPEWVKDDAWQDEFELD